MSRVGEEASPSISAQSPEQLRHQKAGGAESLRGAEAGGGRRGQAGQEPSLGTCEPLLRGSPERTGGPGGGGAAELLMQSR